MLNNYARGSIRPELIQCTDLIYSSNHKASNKMDYRNGRCVKDLGASFSGNDKVFIFKAEDEELRYTITLSNLEKDLDLFVYTIEGSRIAECKAISINPDAEN